MGSKGVLTPDRVKSTIPADFSQVDRDLGFIELGFGLVGLLYGLMRLGGYGGYLT
jgi:hypothetical protein